MLQKCFYHREGTGSRFVAAIDQSRSERHSLGGARTVERKRKAPLSPLLPQSRGIDHAQCMCFYRNEQNADFGAVSFYREAQTPRTYFFIVLLGNFSLQYSISKHIFLDKRFCYIFLVSDWRKIGCSIARARAVPTLSFSLSVNTYRCYLSRRVCFLSTCLRVLYFWTCMGWCPTPCVLCL